MIEETKINQKIHELLEEDEDLAFLNRYYTTKWEQEAFGIMRGEKYPSKEMIQEKRDWIETLTQLALIE
jgi:hypothetical protein